jgi:hypothetical protein
VIKKRDEQSLRSCEGRATTSGTVEHLQLCLPMHKFENYPIFQLCTFKSVKAMRSKRYRYIVGLQFLGRLFLFSLFLEKRLMFFVVAIFVGRNSERHYWLGTRDL